MQMRHEGDGGDAFPVQRFAPRRPPGTPETAAATDVGVAGRVLADVAVGQAGVVGGMVKVAV